MGRGNAGPSSPELDARPQLMTRAARGWPPSPRCGDSICAAPPYYFTAEVRPVIAGMGNSFLSLAFIYTLIREPFSQGGTAASGCGAHLAPGQAAGGVAGEQRRRPRSAGSPAFGPPSGSPASRTCVRVSLHVPKTLQQPLHIWGSPPCIFMPRPVKPSPAAWRPSAVFLKAAQARELP